MLHIVDVSPLRAVFPRIAPKRIDGPKNVRGPIEAAWVQGSHALSFSPESKSRLSELRDPALMSLSELIATQPGPKSAERWAATNPFRPIDTRRHELPSEAALLRDAGIPASSLDIPLPSGDMPDLVDPGDGFDGPAPYVYPDPREQERIAWEQMTTKSSGVVRIHRRKRGNGDIVVVDRPGEIYNPATGRRDLIARIWTDLHPATGDQVYVFDPTKPFNYNATVAYYVRRIRSVNDGHYPTFDEQAEAARDARFLEANAPKIRPNIPLADREPYLGPDPDPEIHAPYEDIDVDDLLTDALATRLYGRQLDQLWPEEIAELTASTIARLTERSRSRRIRLHDPRRVRYINGRPVIRSRAAALMAKPHSGEYIASDEGIFD